MAFVITNPHYFTDTHGLEVCVGVVKDTQDVIIIRTTDGYNTQLQVTIEDGRHRLYKNGPRRQGTIDFVKELMATDYKNYIPFVAGIDEFKTALPNGTQVRLGEDHPYAYIVVKTLPNGDYIMRSSRHQKSFGTTIPKDTVENAAFSRWQV